MRFGLVFAVLSISSLAAFGQSTDPKNLPVTYSLSGPEMYKTWCASCHGLLGKGDGPAATSLKKMPTDLTMLAKKNGGKFPTERVRSYIEGTASLASHGSREMPVWGDFFRQLGDERAAMYRVVTLSSYVESLQTK